MLHQTHQKTQKLNQKKIEAETPTLPLLLAASASSIKKDIREATSEIATLREDGKKLSEALLEIDMDEIEVTQKLQESEIEDISNYLETTISEALGAESEYGEKFNAIIKNMPNW